MRLGFQDGGLCAVVGRVPAFASVLGVDDIHQRLKQFRGGGDKAGVTVRLAVLVGAVEHSCIGDSEAVRAVNDRLPRSAADMPRPFCIPAHLPSPPSGDAIVERDELGAETSSHAVGGGARFAPPLHQSDDLIQLAVGFLHCGKKGGERFSLGGGGHGRSPSVPTPAAGSIPTLVPAIVLVLAAARRELAMDEEELNRLRERVEIAAKAAALAEYEPQADDGLLIAEALLAVLGRKFGLRFVLDVQREVYKKADNWSQDADPCRRADATEMLAVAEAGYFADLIEELLDDEPSGNA